MDVVSTLSISSKEEHEMQQRRVTVRIDHHAKIRAL